MGVKVSYMVLPPITNLHITLGHIRRLWVQWEDNSTHPSLPYSAIMLQIDWSGPVFETLNTSGTKHVRESPRHVVVTYNWFAHYLWDIYGGFGHNGKIIQRTLPSHTQPSCSKLTVWASFQNFAHFGSETCARKCHTRCYRP